MKYFVDLSSPVHSNDGMSKALYRLYYGNSGLDDLIEMTGYPHNGGEHTCIISGSKEDIIAWLDMLESTYYGIELEIKWIKREIENSNKVSLRKFYAKYCN